MTRYEKVIKLALDFHVTKMIQLIKYDEDCYQHARMAGHYAILLLRAFQIN